MESHALLLWWLYDTFIFWSLKVWLNRLYMEKQKSGFIIIYIYLSFWRWTKVLWDNIRVTKWWQNLFSFLLFIYLFLHELPPLNLIHRNINLSIENLRLTVYGKAIHLSMKSSLEKKKKEKPTTLYFILKLYKLFPPFPQNLCCYSTMYPPVTFLFSPIWSVCWLLGSLSYWMGKRAVGWQRETKYYCYLIGLNWHDPGDSLLEHLGWWNVWRILTGLAHRIVRHSFLSGVQWDCTVCLYKHKNKKGKKKYKTKLSKSCYILVLFWYKKAFF